MKNKKESLKHRPVIEINSKKKSISDEPEMIELERMIKAGELKTDRLIDHLQEKK
jgi:hypothetical protein